MLTLLSLFGVELGLGAGLGLVGAIIKNPAASSILKSAGRHLFKKIALQDYTPAEREIAKKRSDEMKKLPLNQQASMLVRGFR